MVLSAVESDGNPLRLLADIVVVASCEKWSFHQLGSLTLGKLVLCMSFFFQLEKFHIYCGVSSWCLYINKIPGFWLVTSSVWWSSIWSDYTALWHHWLHAFVFNVTVFLKSLSSKLSQHHSCPRRPNGRTVSLRVGSFDWVCFLVFDHPTDHP